MIKLWEELNYLLINYMVTGAEHHECQNHLQPWSSASSIQFTLSQRSSSMILLFILNVILNCILKSHRFYLQKQLLSVRILCNDRSFSSPKFIYMLQHTTINCANNLTFPSPLVSLLPWNVNLLTVSATITQPLYSTIHTVCLKMCINQSQMLSQQQSNRNHTYKSMHPSSVTSSVCFF